MTDKLKMTTDEIFNDFILKTKYHFVYLVKQFGFLDPKVKIDNNTANMQYLSADLAVLINFSPLDEMIQISIRKIINGEIAGYYDNENSILLSSLVMYKDADFRIPDIKPKPWWEFEDCLIQNSKMLFIFGSTVLSGEEWINERQVLERMRKSLK